MQEIIVPEDGLIYKTIDGIPIMQIEHKNDSAIFSLYGKNDNSKILLICSENGNGVFIENGKKDISLTVNSDQNEIRFNNGNSNIVLVCLEDGSGITIQNGQKYVGLTAYSERNEIRFSNESGNITHFIRDNEDGGQITLSDDEGNQLLDMGINSKKDGSLVFIRNKNGDSVVSLLCNKNNGLILVSDEDNNTIWST
jgi:hypothetical protein